MAEFAARIPDSVAIYTKKIIMTNQNDDQTKDKNLRTRDEIYANYHTEVEKFAFDQKVAQVFEDMIHRSIPGYDAILAMIGVLAGRYAKDGTHCYDLGASLGGVSFAIIRNTQNRNCKIIAIDNSSAMVQQLCTEVSKKGLEKSILVQQADIREINIKNASVVVLNFTLQFLDPGERGDVIRNIFEGMLPGSIFILSEKIKFPDQQEDEFQIDMYHEFKRLHGYSELEISQKRNALEDVLIPDTLHTHLERLRGVGFQSVYTWFQCFNFVSIVAIK